MKGPLNLLVAFTVVSVAGLQVAAAQAPQAPRPTPEQGTARVLRRQVDCRGRDEAGPDGPRWKNDYHRHLRVVRRAVQRHLPFGRNNADGSDEEYMTMASVPRGTVRGDS